jgi:hypothetical protein
MPIPPGYKLQPEFTDPLRLIRLDPDPRKGHGHIDIGKVESLESKAEREDSARDPEAGFERESRGKLSIEVTTRTLQVLLADRPVRYVSVLIYDDRHYMRITDTDPELWKRMLQQCANCGR